jgi:hypothetical protein
VEIAFCQSRSFCAQGRGCARTRTRTHPVRCPQLLLEESLWDNELARAVDEALEVLKVARQAHVAEYGLLELAVERVVGAVDAYARQLLLYCAALGLHPVHVALVALHVRKQVLDARARDSGRHKLDPALDNVELADVDCLHGGSGRGRGASGRMFFFESATRSAMRRR